MNNKNAHKQTRFLVDLNQLAAEGPSAVIYLSALSLWIMKTISQNTQSCDNSSNLKK